jgi:hypothetical protein
MGTIAELKITRAALIREHIEALAALDVVIAMMETRERTVATEKMLSPIEKAIGSIMQDAPDTPWTSRTLFDLLDSKGVEVSGKDDAAKVDAVGYALGRLVTRGLLEIVSNGKGRRATVYAWKGDANEKEVAEATS